MSHTTMTSICGVSTSYGISGSWASQAAAKLACQRSPVNGLRPKLHRSRQPISRATTRKVITMGLPIPIIGPLFNPVFAALAYALGAARFWSNFNKTSFDGSQKAKLTALWPILFIGSQSFRQDFKKTLNS